MVFRELFDLLKLTFSLAQEIIVDFVHLAYLFLLWFDLIFLFCKFYIELVFYLLYPLILLILQSDKCFLHLLASFFWLGSRYASHEFRFLQLLLQLQNLPLHLLHPLIPLLSFILSFLLTHFPLNIIQLLLLFPNHHHTSQHLYLLLLLHHQPIPLSQILQCLLQSIIFFSHPHIPLCLFQSISILQLLYLLQKPLFHILFPQKDFSSPYLLHIPRQFYSIFLE